MLTEAAAQSLSDQQFNLYLTLTPSFDMNGRMLQWATIKIVKNSMGKTGEIQVRTDLAHLRWVEDEYHSPSQTERLRAALPSAAAQQKEGEVIQNDDQNHAVA